MVFRFFLFVAARDENFTYLSRFYFFPPRGSSRPLRGNLPSLYKNNETSSRRIGVKDGKRDAVLKLC